MSKMNFSKFMAAEAARLLSEGHKAAAHVRRSALHSFTAYKCGGEVRFSEITPQLLKGYENYLFLCNKSKNTVSTYLRALRATCNRAKDCWRVSFRENLFRDVFTGVDAPTKRALQPCEVERAMTAQVSEGLKRTQAYFSLMFQLHGMPFIDLAHLRKCDFQDGFITYSRHKTGQKLYIAAFSSSLSKSIAVR